MPPVTGITVLYDAACGFCTFAKDWMLRQPPLIRIEFLAAGSNEAKQAFPQLPPGELAVVADTGEVWLGNHAWIVCLWALQRYRGLSFRLTSPPLMLLSRQAFAAVSKTARRFRGCLAFEPAAKLRSH